MILRADPTFPNRRAWVLKLRCDATPAALCGRLENLITGDHVDFASAGELCALLAGAIECRDVATAYDDSI
jgi:hypothetical protein